MKKIITLFISFVFILAFFIGNCSDDNIEESEIVNDESLSEDEDNIATVEEDSAIELVLIPKYSNALEVPLSNGSLPEQILYRYAYTTSYNNKTKCPNWVAWHLTAEHLDGPYNRKGVPYYGDDGSILGISSSVDIVHNSYLEDLEAEAPRQEHSDWREHPDNIDHGHMCPAADCKWSKEVINQSFLLTNMCPQNHDLNGGDWEYLEDRCRTWAKRYGDIYIVAGPIFKNGSPHLTMGLNKVGIPDAFFKVVLCLKDTPKALGFIYPNNGIHHKIEEYVLTVDEVEDISSIDFFHSLPDDIESKIEAHSNLKNW